MASFFAAAAKTPVSTLIMVSELTSGYALLLPAMWVCALAYLTSGNRTLYREQVATRLESPAHRSDFIVDVVEGMRVREAIREIHRNFVTVPLKSPLPELNRIIANTIQSAFPVVDDEGRYVGLFSFNDIREFLYDSEVGSLAIAEDLVSHGVAPLREDMLLSDALHRFAESRYRELPVVSEEQPDRVIAMLSHQDVMSIYDRRLLELKAN
jgi:CIC family chloride channel protein